MAFSSLFLMISALLICSCSANVTSETGETTTDPEPTAQTESETSLPAETTSQPEATVPTDPVTSETGETTMDPEPTAQTESETSLPAETTSRPEATVPTDTVTSETGETTMDPEPTAQTESETSLPAETTSRPEATVPTSQVTFETGETTMDPEPTAQTESETSLPAETTSQSEPTVPTDTVTSETGETTMDPEPTAQTESETSLPAETTSQPEATVPTDPVTSETGETTSAPEQTSPTDTVTSEPGQTTMTPEPTGSTDVETSVPTQTTSVIEPSNTVTSESAHTTSTETPSTTDPLSTQSTGPPSSPPTEPPTKTPTVTPSSLPTDPSNTLPTTQPTIPSSKPPTDPLTTPPATTQTTNRPINTAEPITCQNGGYLNGSNCKCLLAFSGEFCDNFDTFQTDTLNRSVLVNLWLNQEFNDEYEDETSSEYKEFVRNFTNQMKTYYMGKNITNFLEVVVTSVSRGDPLVRLSDKAVEKIKLFKQSTEAMAIYSITPRAEGVSVTHDVVLAIPNNASFNQLYDNDFSAVQKAVVELVGCPTECPYNITAQPEVKPTELDLGSLCKTLVANNNVAKYEAVTVNGVVKCVTLCDIHHSTPRPCNYMGLCRVYSSIGPFCHCQNMDSTWYLGDDCSFPILRTAFYVGLSVTLACLLVAVGVLTACLLFNKRKQTLRRDIKNQQVNQWLTEDFKWSRPNSSNDTLNAGDYKNPSFTHEESAIHREMPGVYRRPTPVHQFNGPSMDIDSRQWSPSEATYPSSQTVTGHDRPFSNATSLNLRDFSSNLMRINKPQNRSSWDA